MSKETAEDTKPDALVAFQYTDLLDRFCGLNKRSPSLDGSLPMRAAQHCTPVVEGSSAGAQILIRFPFSVKKRKNGYHVEMSAAGAEALDRVPGALKLALKSGLLRRGGYWHTLLEQGGMSLHGDRLSIWTGLIIHPKADIWLLTTGAFNRRSRAEVVPQVIASEGPVPLVLEVNLAATRFDGALRMDEEIGCILPVRPRVKMRLTKVENELDVARSFLDYFDRQYQDEKARHPTGKYRRLNARASREIAPTCEARVACYGPAAHRVREFQSFASDAGVTKKPAIPGELAYVEICNGPAAKFTFDGNVAFDIDHGLSAYAKSFEKFFKRHFPDSKDSFPGVDDYLAPGARGEPILGIVPWAFAVTTTGWSSVVDAYHHPALDIDGMRGVISTDWFHPILNAFRFHRPGSFTLRRGIPLMRVLPVPRDLLKATWERRGTTSLPTKARVLHQSSGSTKSDPVA